ncbi:cobaltochelatase subunit CobN [Methanobrevibacter curvatus]|uniref:Aerobic cobaltochelatase subunit CobN n=1 Tax=Methanobrevibacter curvatus TaxID=49547 RepID=A0A166CDL0_9EURY|nr:cobaltochelatase subunit CobN [Methanobrevibacter curvatus]KZX14395.1 aerobic cobaltochelatase subunit CobN [Methanobrevibacter curvatus]
MKSFGKITAILLLLIIVLVVCNSVYAASGGNGNNTSPRTEAGISSLSFSYLGGSSYGGSSGVQTTPTVIINVKEAYNESSKKYNENGFILPNASVKVFNKSNNKLVYSSLTGVNGKIIFNLNPGNYIFNISYSSYLTYSKAINISSNTNTLTLNHTFVPDIAFVASYGGYKVKIDSLMKLSKRIYFLDYWGDLEQEKLWMLEHANFVYLDMYAAGSSLPSDIFNGTPANNNFKIAYSFGIYDTEFLNSLGLNFIGANSANNTPHTIENTYLGSYFRAEEVKDSDDTTILKENLNNMLNYIFYLLGETSVNPTLNVNKTPKLTRSSWGLYHPDYGVWEYKPSDSLINQWILANPGYSHDGIGSLNWVSENYVQWQELNAKPENLYKMFETWYNKTKPGLNNSFVVVASYYPGGKLIDNLIKSYEAKGRATFNLFQFEVNPSMAELLLRFDEFSSRGLASVNSLYSWSLDFGNMGENGGAIDEFTKMNIEIIKAVDGISEYSYKNAIGPQAEWTYAVTIPSFEGVFGAIAVSYLDGDGKEQIIQPGVDKLVETTLGWVNLKEKENKDKKIAVIFYNYPPGKAEIGASYLDVFQSLHDLLEQLSDAGYNIGMKKNEIPNSTALFTILAAFGNKGTWATGLLNKYVQDNWEKLNLNQQLVDLNQYMAFFNSLNPKLQESLVDYWGADLGKIMVYNDSYIVIPGIKVGNIFITFQPSRGWEEVENYHDLTMPPHQQYVTFYKWLKETYKVDAMIHMGTHGTLEWLPGRSIGLQDDDWTFELMGIPNIYPYIVSNPGEALVAKERAGALVISHMTPATVISALYGDLITLNTYITNYDNAKNVNSSLAEEYKEMILELSKTLAIDRPKSNESFDNWLEKTHLLLEDLQNDVITLGLHSLGYILTGTALVNETITIVSSKTKVYDEIKNYLYPSLHNLSYHENMLHSTKYISQVKAIQDFFASFVTALVNGSITVDSYLSQKGISKNSVFGECLTLANTTINQILNNEEWKAIMTALEGGYVLPGLAADPSYGDVLPTGKNVFSVDTTKMPTKAAWENGKKIADKIVVDYYEKHKAFPELVGLIIWGTELLRTEGVGIAEFLYLLGVEPVYSTTGTVTGCKLIPLSDLKIKLSNGTVINRPRIDTYASAVTSNNNWLKLMTTAVNLVFYNTTGENESVNFVKKHYAQNPSLDRIFGLPGAILEGTGYSNYLPNTNKWENSTNIRGDLAEIYLSRVSFAWSVDEKGRVVVSPSRANYEYLLKKVDLISQNIDSTWRFLDSDDYFDWFGGMLGTSQHSGGNPDTAIVDTRNKNDMVSRNLKEQLDFEIRSTVLNPVYRDALLNTPAGYLNYAKKYEYIFDFQMAVNGIDGENLLSSELINNLANNILDPAFEVNSDYSSYAVQSMAGYLIELNRKGMWQADSKTVSELANKIIQSTIAYGVACCHHTCANIEFNKFVIKMSTLSDPLKKQYSDALQASSLGASAYTETNVETDVSNSKDSSSKGSSESSDSLSPSSSSSPSAEAKSVEEEKSKNNQDTGAGEAEGSSSSESYEVSKKSSSSSEDSSMPVIIIAGVLVLVVLIAVGYFRKTKNDDDEY